MTHTVKELVKIAKENGVEISYQGMYRRWKRGWDEEKMVTTRVRTVWAKRSHPKISNHEKICNYIANLPVGYEFTIASLTDEINNRKGSSGVTGGQVGQLVKASDRFEKLGRTCEIRYFFDENGEKMTRKVYKIMYRVKK